MENKTFDIDFILSNIRDIMFQHYLNCAKEVEKYTNKKVVDYARSKAEKAMSAHNIFTHLMNEGKFDKIFDENDEKNNQEIS